VAPEETFILRRSSPRN